MRGNIREYWKAVRALEGSLPEFVWLVATAAGAPPFVTQVAAGAAARLLYAKTHRVAEDEEVEAHRANDADAIKVAKRNQMRRNGAAVVAVEATSEPTPRRRR